MWDGYIGRQIRRANLRLLLASVTLLVLAGALVVGNGDLLRTWVQGARLVTAEQAGALARTESPGGHVIRFDVAKAIPTGYQQVESENGRTTGVSAEYVLVWAGEQLLAVRVAPGTTPTRLEGTFRSIARPLEDGLRKDLGDERQGLLLPMMLDTLDYRETRWYVLVPALFMTLLAGFNLYRLSKRVRDLASHPIVAGLGGPRVLQMHGMELETEIHGPVQSFGPARLTQHWIVVPTTFSTRIARLEDLVWMHLQVTRHSVNFIPTGKTFAAHLHHRSGSSLSVQAREEKVSALLTAIATRIPWAVCGYSDELAALWRKQRDTFVAEVDQRRNTPARRSPAA